MKRPFSLGDLVRFKTATGQYAEGIVIHRIVEKRQPTIFLIECEDRRRAFRFETETQPDRRSRTGRGATCPGSRPPWRLPSSPALAPTTEPSSSLSTSIRSTTTPRQAWLCAIALARAARERCKMLHERLSPKAA